MELLDFSQTLENASYTAHVVMGSKDKVCVIPKNLRIHTLPNGKPVLRLEAIRGITPFSKPKPYGLLEIQFSPGVVKDTIIEKIQKKWSNTNVHTPDFSGGYLGIQTVGNEENAIAKELETPSLLTQMPLSKLRLVKRISMPYLKMMEDALEKELLLFKAYGVYSVKGYAPRVNTAIAFDPAILSSALLALKTSANNTVSLSELQAFFNKSLKHLPVNLIKNESTNSDLLKLAIRDWYINRFCSVLPPKPETSEVMYQINEDAFLTGEFTWDFTESLVVEHHFYFSLDTLKEARKVVKEKGIAALSTTSIIQPLPHGFLRVAVFHPFFNTPRGIKQIGIKLNAQPNSPHRNQAIDTTITFDKGQETKIVSLQFSPKEFPEYTVTPYVIYEDNEGTKEVLGTSQTTSSEELIIPHDVFPFQFSSLICSNNLQEQAKLLLEVKKVDQEIPFLEPIILDKNNPKTILALPKENTNQFEYHITAKNLDTEKQVTNTIPLALNQKIDITSFREYGTHEVKLKFETPITEIVALDLLPEYLESESKNITTISFSKEKQERTWSWFSPSIFKAGFKYRIHGQDDESWSEIQSPFIEKIELNHQTQSL